MCGSVVAASGFDQCLKYTQNVAQGSNGDMSLRVIAHQSELTRGSKVEKECLL